MTPGITGLRQITALRDHSFELRAGPDHDRTDRSLPWLEPHDPREDDPRHNGWTMTTEGLRLDGHDGPRWRAG